jgi:peptidoglycan hydrolase-like protein with peptidoglycan-binding domain
MYRTALALLALTALTATSSAQTDTTRRDTTRTRQAGDTTRRSQAESRGEIDLTASKARFDVGMPNFGFSTAQAAELQQALTRAGCDAGTADGVVGQRTLLGIKCFRGQRNLNEVGIEEVLTALGLSFARPAEPVPAPEPAPPRRDSTVLPPVIRQDSTYRPDVRARRDSAMRDSVRRDSLRRDSTARRDTTRRP